jgi:hypothetical protein
MGFVMAEKKKKAETAKSDKKEASTEAMSAIELLEADHAEVERDFEKYEQLEDAAEK